MPSRSTAERLDDAVDALLAGQRPIVEPELQPLLRVAELTAGALRPIPAADRLEARLAGRLVHEGLMRRTAGAVSTFTRRELGQPGRLLAAGAVSTAAVGVSITAFAMWRSSRHHATVPHRLLGR